MKYACPNQIDLRLEQSQPFNVTEVFQVQRVEFQVVTQGSRGNQRVGDAQSVAQGVRFEQS